MLERQITVELIEPITGHGGAPVKSVVLNAPAARDYFELGDPQVFARNPDGTIYAVENENAVSAYLDRCVGEPGPLMLKHLSLADAMAVKAALLRFFHAAREAMATK